MLLIYCILILIFVIYNGHADVSCKEVSVTGYKYQSPLLPIGVSLRHTKIERDKDLKHFEMRIGIKASKDGLILLSPHPLVEKMEKKTKVFEIVVGGTINTWSGLRLARNGPVDQCLNTPEILNISRFTEFDIKILNGRLEFSFANGTSIIEYNDNLLYSVKYFGFAGWDLNDNKTFRYDCPFWKEDSEAESSKLIIYVACGIIIVVLTLGVCTVLVLRKRRKAGQKLQSDIADLIYADMISNEDPISTPIHLSELYATPTDTCDPNTYSEPYTPASVDEMYTKPAPKHMRRPIEITYSELQFDKSFEEGCKTLENSAGWNSKQAPISGHNYVEVRPQIKPLEGSGRESNTIKYVNVNSKDYDAEPSYCEVSVAKNY